MLTVLGVDGCRDGWCGVEVALSADCREVVPSGTRIYPSFADLLATSADIICIDIPIGLSRDPRACDLEARRIIGHPGGSRVFPPPCREALGAATHRAACDTNRRFAGRGISQQAFQISPKIQEVDALVTPPLQERVREVHPEVCFRALAGELVPSKKTVAGLRIRWALLRDIVPGLAERPSLGADMRGKCRLDDYLDALVAAWTGVCILRGTAVHLPETPPRDERGLRMEIWRPASAPAAG